MIVLTGMPGSGKSTVATSLGSALNTQVFDSDQLVSARFGDLLGDSPTPEQWSAFRAAEQQTVLELLKTRCGVLALGGGAWSTAGTRGALLSHHFCVYLRCTIDTLVARGVGRHRVMFRSSDPRTALRELLEGREKEYQMANLAVTVDHVSADTIAKFIASSVVGMGKCDAVQ